MKKAFFIILVLLLIGILYFLNQSGFFANIEITEEGKGPFQLVYQEYTGDYKNASMIIDQVYQALKDEKVEPLLGFGIYYDRPGKVKKEELKSDLGCILEKKDYGRIEHLEKKFNVKKFSRTNCIVASLPFNNQFSIMIGIVRVYPRLFKYLSQKGLKGGPVMEIYNIPEKKIIYIIPLKK
ncbi:MAG: GyrI-like domain-containing protein [Spirochaetes bacterium]|nr:GyrI-like domain-containing protein [Spirochaetota bacterium]